MAELKTKATAIPVSGFIDAISDEDVRTDCHKIVEIMEDVTGYKATMWGSSIIGFGRYHYKYESGREGEMCIAGFSPRKTNITFYLKSDEALLKKLGKYKATGGCVHIKHLDDIDVGILRKLTINSIKEICKMHTVIK